MRTQMKRFNAPRSLLSAQRLAVLIPRIDVAALAGVLIYTVTVKPASIGIPFAIFETSLAVIAHMTLYSVSAQLGGMTGGAPLRVGEQSGISIISRAYIAAMTIVGVHGIEPLSPWILIAILALAWAPTALLAVRIGYFVHPVAYPFTMLAPIVVTVRRSSWRYWPKIGAVSFLGLIIVSAFVGLVALAVTFSAAWRDLTLICIGILFIVPGVFRLWLFIRDVWAYRTWERARLGELDVSDLMHWLAIPQTASTAARILADVRLRNLLDASDETYGFLADVAHASQRGRSAVSESVEWRTEGFGAWLQEVAFFRGRRGAVGEQGLEDEIARLVRTLRERPQVGSVH